MVDTYLKQSTRYLVLTALEGKKEILGLYISENEGGNVWVQLVNGHYLQYP